MTPVKRKLDIDTSDQTKIQKKARSKISRKRNENTTFLEIFATEAVSSSQAEVEFCQKRFEQRQVVEEEDGKQEEVEEQGKINKVQEEEGENTEVEVVDIEAFKNYPRGHESFHLTVDYMLKPLGEKTSNSFGFPWVFMTSHVLQHVTHVATDESSVAAFVTHVATNYSFVATNNSY
ncbi:hypothetical protein EJD97_010410 [Solanum chilense]|uniref:Uncharacterized protein n=1 Tax=Solanum chilense TaxID=4083 RepID=A0A6N2BHP5_SOLCI|nr:hypothetical protein EJD97_010410 [Solanum chilense]